VANFGDASAPVNPTSPFMTVPFLIAIPLRARTPLLQRSQSPIEAFMSQIGRPVPIHGTQHPPGVGAATPCDAISGDFTSCERNGRFQSIVPLQRQKSLGLSDTVNACVVLLRYGTDREIHSRQPVDVIVC
jgi:hypothetical protein